MIITIVMFLILTVVGLITLRSVTNEKRLFSMLPAGMILGASIYIFLLNWNFKILHGQIGIIVSTVEFLLLGLFLYITYRNRWIKLESTKSVVNLFCFSLVLVIIYLSAFKMLNQLPAADASMQWAYAATFARGNYPISAPWQPDLEPNYHLGAYFLEGALYSLSGLPILTVHTLMNIYLLVSGSILAIFVFWENRYSFRNIWLVFACLVLFISFGVIILTLPDIIQKQSLGGIVSLNQLMTTVPAKGAAGAALVDLNILSYLPARSLSLGLALLALYFVYSPFKSINLKILTFALLLAITALVEESMFLPMFLTVGSVFVVSLFSFIPKIQYLKQHRKALLLIILLTSMLVILQGGFISENISENPLNNKESVYRLTLPLQDGSFEGKFNIFKNVNLDTVSPLLDWLVPSPVLLILILLIYSYFKRDSKLGLIGIFSTFSFISYLTLEYKYCGSCSIRLHSFGNIAAGFGFMLLIFSVFKDLSLRKNLVGLFIITPTLILPTFIPDLIAQSNKIQEGIKDGVKGIIFSPQPQSPPYKVMNWANKNLPLNSRVIVVDSGLPSPAGALNFQYRGLYTTLGPQYIHVNRQEPGPEYFDLLLTLNPSVLKQTKTEYVYIESESAVYKQLPQARLDDLANSNYFQILQSIDLKDTTSGNKIFFRLYKVLPKYLDENIGGKEIKEGTLDSLQKLIPNDSSVYVEDYGDPPKLSFWYKMALVLTLKNKDLRYNFSQTDYQIIETYIPHRMGDIAEKYDYYILAPDTKPPVPSELIWSNLYAKGWKRD